MKLDTAIMLYCEEQNFSRSGNAAINLPDKIVGPPLRDVARRRITKTNPDIDAEKHSPSEQADNAAFVGKKYRVQDTHYGHLISEHDDENEAKKAANARPFSRVISFPEPQHEQSVRDMVRRKVVSGK